MSDREDILRVIRQLTQISDSLAQMSLVLIYLFWAIFVAALVAIVHWW